MSKLKSLDALSLLLLGKLPPNVDWMAVLALANETLVTPQIYASALRAGIAAELRPDVRDYLQEVGRRNRERNRRLLAQLRDTMSILNSAGIEPTLIKGSAFWAAMGRPADHDRIMADIDLVVEQKEEDAALAALEAAGFTTYARYSPSFHVVAELGRSDDVGIVDLHRRPPGPERLASGAMAAPGQLRNLAWDGVRAKVPTPTLQVFLMVLHDQFQDGGYWRGGFALRHLVEIAALSRGSEGVDWGMLQSLAATRLVRNVTDAHLRASETLCGALTPMSARRLWVRLQHARLRAQFRWPRLQPLLVRFSG